MLKTLQPEDEIFEAFEKMFRKIWDHFLAAGVTRAQSLKAELARIEKEVGRFLDRIADTDTPSVVKADEGRIQKLETEKLIAAEKLASCGRPVRSFDETFLTAVAFLRNPYKCWLSPRPEYKEQF